MTVLVIPVADLAEQSSNLLEGLLNSIVYHNHQEKYPIVVCFDGCHQNFVEGFITKYPFIDPVVNDGNRLNFCGNSNNGLRLAYNKYKDNAIIVNQDTVLPSNLDLLFGGGVVSPNQVTVCDGPPVTEEGLKKLEEVQPDQITRLQHLKVTGFCLFINKQVIEKVGYLDEYFKAGFDDDDYCVRTTLAGFPVETVNVMVHHYISKSGNDYISKLQLRFAQFKYKWSIPDNISHTDCNKYITEVHTWLPEMRCE